MIRLMSLSAVLSFVVLSGMFCDAKETKLIQVKPQNNVEYQAPSEEQQDDVFYPKPKDQMYVFWFLGKILSYPVDMVEGYIVNFKKKREVKEGAPVKASAGSQGNPFDNVNWREIPPAPPIPDR